MILILSQTLLMSDEIFLIAKLTSILNLINLICYVNIYNIILLNILLHNILYYII